MENQENIIIEEQKAPAKEKTRRIGTMTMGFALIIVGITIIIGMFNPSLDMTLVAKLSPLILIALGLEIIVSTFIFKGEKLKYDFWSGFVCFILIMTSIGLAIVPKLYNDYIRYYGPERNALNTRITEELEDGAYMVLKSFPEIGDVDASFTVTANEFDKNMTVADLKSEDYISLHISLDDEFASKKEFSEISERILKAVATMNVPFDHFVIDTVNSKEFWYCLNVDGKIGMNASAEKLERSVEFTDLREPEIDVEYNDGIDMAPLAPPDAPDAPNVTIAVPDAPEMPEAPEAVTEMTAVTTILSPKQMNEKQNRYEFEDNKKQDGFEYVVETDESDIKLPPIKVDVEEPVVTKIKVTAKLP